MLHVQDSGEEGKTESQEGRERDIKTGRRVRWDRMSENWQGETTVSLCGLFVVERTGWHQNMAFEGQTEFTLCDRIQPAA